MSKSNEKSRQEKRLKNPVRQEEIRANRRQVKRLIDDGQYEDLELIQEIKIEKEG